VLRYKRSPNCNLATGPSLKSSRLLPQSL